MPSPFPGVDPFIEGQGVWHDFHRVFVAVWRELLMRCLPPAYIARLEERAYVDRVALADDDPLVTATSTVGREVLAGDPIREGYVRVVRRSDDRTVTILEVLTPSGKQGVGRGEYLVRREELLRQPVHFVELDLLLRGPRLLFERKPPDGHFFALVSRSEQRPERHVYAWTLREPLPVIPIPLEAPDRDVAVDLQAVFATTFERGPYDRLVRYDRPVGVRLDAEMGAWVQERVAARPR